MQLNILTQVSLFPYTAVSGSPGRYGSALNRANRQFQIGKPQEQRAASPSVRWFLGRRLHADRKGHSHDSAGT